jgi:hypothetical protein
VNPENHVSYAVVAQTPEYRVSSMNDLGNVTVTGGAQGVPSQLLGGVAKLARGDTEPLISHYDVQPTIDIYAATQGRDLGAVAGDVQHAIHQLAKEQPKTVTVVIRGQYATMNTAFSGLGFGLLAAIVLIYLLIVVNFQSWTDPLVIISALPAALAGIVWMLFVTGTTLSVPALTGAIMCMGIATANSILVISFARERLHVLGDATKAALEAGFVRFRPVLMTALAMVIGMLPMALGLGDGGEQNAPLGRAVIGGLSFATLATLFFVPTLFAIAHRNYKPGDERGRARARPSRATTTITTLPSIRHPIMHEQSLLPDDDQQPDTGGLKRLGVGVAVVALVVAGVGVALRLHANSGLHGVSAEAAIPNVSVVIPAPPMATMNWCCRATFRPSTRRRSMRAPAAM